MNQNKFDLLKNHLLHILFLVFLLIGALYFVYTYGAKQLVENKATLATEETNFNNIQKDYEALKEENDKKRRQQEEEERVRLENEKNQVEKPIFKTAVVAGDSFSTNAPLFEDIIRLLKANGLKLISVENKSSGVDDPIVQYSGSKFNSCQINMQILGSYNHFQKFLTHLYDYPYLIHITSLEVIPFDKDKKTLIFKLSLILYSETSTEGN